MWKPQKRLENTTEWDLPGIEGDCWASWWSEHLQTWSPIRSNDNLSHHLVELDERVRSLAGMISMPANINLVISVDITQKNQHKNYSQLSRWCQPRHLLWQQFRWTRPAQHECRSHLLKIMFDGIVNILNQSTSLALFKSFWLSPCNRLPRKYFDQSVFWSSITSRVKQRSLLNACTRVVTVVAAAVTWSRAAPVKLWTRCSKLSRDFAGLVGADVPVKQREQANVLRIEIRVKLKRRKLIQSLGCSWNPINVVSLFRVYLYLPLVGPFPKLSDKSPLDVGPADAVGDESRKEREKKNNNIEVD